MLVDDLGFGKDRNPTGLIPSSLILSKIVTGGFVSVHSCVVMLMGTMVLKTNVNFFIYVLSEVVSSDGLK